MPVPRDNVIFESGMFMGKLGRRRTFLVCDVDDKIKLPSDLKGLTCVTYSHEKFEEDAEKGLESAIQTILDRFQSTSYDEDCNTVRAFIDFIPEETPLNDTYISLIGTNISRIRADVQRLANAGDWHTIIEIKRRMKEYFEYSGKFIDGIEFAQFFYDAYNKIGEYKEAAWTRIKDKGYLLILAGRFKDARNEINDVLSGLSGKDDETLSHKAYCYKYLGISFQRDYMKDLVQAKKLFNQAQKCIDKMTDGNALKKELQAGILGNYGNLALEIKDMNGALEYYYKELELYEELHREEHTSIVNLEEHIGVAKLQIGSALVEFSRKPNNDINEMLSDALDIFNRIGWIEGQGRVFEQWAKHYRLLFKASFRPARKYFELALENANHARSLYGQIENKEKSGRIEELIRSIKREGRS